MSSLPEKKEFQPLNASENVQSKRTSNGLKPENQIYIYIFSLNIEVKTRVAKLITTKRENKYIMSLFSTFVTFFT